MIDAHLAKLRKRSIISAEEEKLLRDSIIDPRRVDADQVIIPAGVEVNQSTLLLEGWTARVHDLANGQRQISELHVPGDFVDLHSFTLKRLDHDLVALTQCTVAVLPHDRLREISERLPHLTRVYWFATNLDAAIHRQWEVSLGRRTALAAMAALFCELYIRLDIIGRTRGDSFDFPLTQERLAECLGMTAVHANRTLQELRARELIRLQGKVLTILDRNGLQEAGEFSPDYLYLECRPR